MPNSPKQLKRSAGLLVWVLISVSAIITGNSGRQSMAAENKYRILHIMSYHAPWKWTDDQFRAFKFALKDLDVEYRVFQMDTKRIPQSQYQQRADLAYQEYEKINPDLVILGDDNALKYLGPRLAYTKKPVVYLGINIDPAEYIGNNARNFTGVLERPLLHRSVYTVKQILGDKVNKILVLFDSGTTSKASLVHVFKHSCQ